MSMDKTSISDQIKKTYNAVSQSWFWRKRKTKESIFKLLIQLEQHIRDYLIENSKAELVETLQWQLDIWERNKIERSALLEVVGDTAMSVGELLDKHTSSIWEVVNNTSLTVDQKLEKIDLETIEVDDIVLPPDPELMPRTGSDVWRKDNEWKDYDRVSTIIWLLADLHIDVSECLILKGKETKNRPLSYHAIIVPKLHKTIFVCNEYGQATYIYDGILEVSDCVSSTKWILRAVGTKPIKCSVDDIDWWKDTIRVHLSSFFVASWEIASVNSIAKKLNKSFEKDKEDVKVLRNLWDMLDDKSELDYEYRNNGRVIARKSIFINTLSNLCYSGFVKSRNEKHPIKRIPPTLWWIFWVIIDCTSIEYKKLKMSWPFIKVILETSQKKGRKLTLKEAQGLQEVFLEWEKIKEINRLKNLHTMIDDPIKITYDYESNDKTSSSNGTFLDAVSSTSIYQGFAASWNKYYPEREIPMTFGGIMGACIDYTKEMYDKLSQKSWFIRLILIESKKKWGKLTLKEAQDLEEIFLEWEKIKEINRLKNLHTMIDDPIKITYDYESHDKPYSGNSTFWEAISNGMRYQAFATSWNEHYPEREIPMEFNGIKWVCIDCKEEVYSKLSRRSWFIRLILIESKKKWGKLTLAEAQKIEQEYLASK